MKRNMAVVAALAIVLFFLNCAPNLKMAVDDPQVQFTDSGKIIYINKVLGGEKDDFFMGSRIDKNEFLRALIESSEKCGLFKRCTDEQKQHDYKLDALVMVQDQPAFGFNMTTTLKVKYTLTDVETEETIFNKLIVASFTATPGDAFIGAARLNAANAGAVRENIKQFLNYLSTQIN